MRQDETTTITIRMEKADMKRLERMAKKLGIKRSTFAKNMVLAGMEDAEFLDAVGLFTLMRKIEQWREKAFEGQQEMQTA